MAKEIIEQFYPTCQEEWRNWLIENHLTKKGVWLFCYKKNTGKPSITWGDAVAEALCFGWIDSVRKSVDEFSYIQLYSPRKAISIWSRINKEKIEKLIREGKMMQAGLESIERARKNGSWTRIDEVEDLSVPKELAKVFRRNKGSLAFFSSLSKSTRKAMLQWVVMAKRPETREKRMQEIAQLAALKQKPKQF
jgi:uncharacterized protein YdeI (YjbR/CyaY-like superfamily)